MSKYELHYNFVHSQLQEQNVRVNSVQGKAASFMTMSVALIGVMGLILTEFAPEYSNLNWFFFWGCAVIAGFSFLLTILFSMTASYVGNRWYISPHPEEMQKQVIDPDNTDEQIWIWTTQAMVKAFHLNEETLTRQAKALTRAMLFFWSEVVFLIALALSVII